MSVNYLLSLALVVASVSPAFGQVTMSSETRLSASNGKLNDYFGQSTSLSADVLLVGAPSRGLPVVSTGQAYIFRKVPGGWIEEAVLIASDASNGDRFGISVSVSGDVAAVGAHEALVGGQNTGAAYVFRLAPGGGWPEEQKLVAPGGQPFDFFGVSVAAHADRIVIGAMDEAGTGAAHVFHHDGSTWLHEATLTASAYRFGVAVAITGDRIVVGADGDDIVGSPSVGAAYVFEHDGVGWAFSQKLVASDEVPATSITGFGEAVAASPETIAVGAWTAFVDGSRRGAAYVYRRVQGQWAEERKLIETDSVARNWFGYSVGANDREVVVGALLKDVGVNPSQGVVYVFQRRGGTWHEDLQLVASDGAAGGRLGLAVAIDGLTVAAGTQEGSIGSTYAFELRSTPVSLCGIGPELAMLLPLLGWIRARRPAARTANPGGRRAAGTSPRHPCAVPCSPLHGRSHKYVELLATFHD